MANGNLDPKGKYLKQEGSGAIFVWNPHLAARDDMRPFDPVTMTIITDSKEVVTQEETVIVRLQGKSFLVKPELKEIIDDMLEFIETQKKVIATLSEDVNEAVGPQEVPGAEPDPKPENVSPVPKPRPKQKPKHNRRKK